MVAWAASLCCVCRCRSRASPLGGRDRPKATKRRESQRKARKGDCGPGRAEGRPEPESRARGQESRSFAPSRLAARPFAALAQQCRPAQPSGVAPPKAPPKGSHAVSKRDQSKGFSGWKVLYAWRGSLSVAPVARWVSWLPEAAKQRHRKRHWWGRATESRWRQWRHRSVCLCWRTVVGLAPVAPRGPWVAVSVAPLGRGLRLRWRGLGWAAAPVAHARGRLAARGGGQSKKLVRSATIFSSSASVHGWGGAGLALRSGVVCGIGSAPHAFTRVLYSSFRRRPPNSL